MLLCDIGNSSFSFYKEGVVENFLIDDFDIDSVNEEVYYICVNAKIEKRLEAKDSWHNLASKIKLDGAYDTLGIDRQVAMLGLENGVVVDAGSAITIDIIVDGKYQGGFIYPGFLAMQKAFSQISSKLDYLLNFEVSFDKMATNSQDAISYGAFVPIIEEIKRISEGKRLILTGGDAKFLANHLPLAELQAHWLFDAMLKIIKP